MFRSIAISILSVAAVASVNAGQIQIGSGVGGQNGLTFAYVTGANGTPAANVTTGVGKVGEINFDMSEFGGAVNGPVGTIPVTPVPFALYNTAVGTPIPAGQTMTDSSAQPDGATSEVFAMIAGDAGTASGSTSTANAWETFGRGPGRGLVTSDIVVPINILGVTQVSTLLNDLFGVNGANDTNVIFNFGHSAGVIDPSLQVTVNLINGIEIDSAVHCRAIASNPTSSTTDTCLSAGFANGPLTATSHLTSGAGETGEANGVTVSAHTIWTSAYTGGPVDTSAYANSSGDLALDAQSFYFGNDYVGDYLINVTVQNVDNQLNSSRTALAGITVDTFASPTPEPSTILLMLAGIGGIAAFRKRRQA